MAVYRMIKFLFMKNDVLKKIIIVSLAGVFFIIWWINFHSLPGLRGLDSYEFRATIYDDFVKYELFFLIPGLFLIATAFRKDIWIGRYSNKITELVDNSPRIVFFVLIPIFSVLFAAMTSKFVIGATPRVLDSFNYLFQAQNFSQGQLFAPIPPLSSYFEFPFIIMKDGKWYGSVYPGFPLLLSIGVLLKKEWMVNPILSGIGIGLIYWTGKILFSESLARWATLLTILSPFYRMMSSIFMSHIAAMIWNLAAIVFIWDWLNREYRSYLKPLAAGICLGMSYLTRPQSSAVVVLPFLIWGGFKILKLKKVRWRSILCFIIPLFCAYSWLSYYNYRLTGDCSINPRYYVDPGRRLGFGENIGVPLRGGHRSGHTVLNGIKNVWVLLNLWNSDSFGWGGWGILGFCSIATLIAVAWRGNLIEYLLFSSIVINLFLYFFYFTASPNFGPRYLTEVFPATVFLSVRGLMKLSDILPKFFSFSKSYLFIVLFGLTVISILIFTPYQIHHYGLLPPVLNKKDVPVPAEEKAVIIIPKDLYQMNVFTWNMPDLDGIIYVRDPGDSGVKDLQTAFPGYRFFLYARDFHCDHSLKGYLKPLANQ